MKKMTLNLTTELQRLHFENHDNCTQCNHQFKDGETQHLGYNQSNQPISVCGNCSYILKETAVRYRYSPRPYDVPNNNAYLWRYMDFAKYMSLLVNKSIFFARADMFDDIYEGAKGSIQNKDLWDNHYLSFFKQAILNPPKGQSISLKTKNVEQEAKRLLNDMASSGETKRKTTFISCWHENNYESEAMWKLYSGFIQNAVAIRTTYQDLYESLGKNPHISIGRVKYIDYNHDFAGVNDAFWRKRKSFEHEKEVRAIIYDIECQSYGKLIPCDIHKLIQEVYVSPGSPEWFKVLVNDVNLKFELNIHVKQSEINSPLFF
ncbi:hypothetical protein ACEF11_01245 [[Pasteurella] aerogenes]|nr:hypothetical protein [[Pasteurella] aerogenes]